MGDVNVIYDNVELSIRIKIKYRGINFYIQGEIDIVASFSGSVLPLNQNKINQLKVTKNLTLPYEQLHGPSLREGRKYFVVYQPIFLGEKNMKTHL